MNRVMEAAAAAEPTPMSTLVMSASSVLRTEASASVRPREVLQALDVADLEDGGTEPGPVEAEKTELEALLANPGRNWERIEAKLAEINDKLLTREES